MPRMLGGTREERGAMGERRAQQSHAGIPRTPRTARIPEASREKKTPSYPLSFFFFIFFLSRILRKVSVRERKREKSRCEIFRGHRARKER